GAPKVGAMQIISELEGYRRGPYAGAVGYALPAGAFDTCIAIRTIVLANGVARLQAGAGIVADSDPAAEDEECLRKLAALERAIVEAFGGEIGPARRLVHGKASPVHHDGRGLFAGLPAEFEAGRYHSLAATAVPDELEISATCAEGEVMGVRHRELPMDGVQFH